VLVTGVQTCALPISLEHMTAIYHRGRLIYMKAKKI
jgi:hypothetical protein